MTNAFWDRGYEVVDDLLDPDLLHFVSQAMDVSLSKGGIRKSGVKFVSHAEDEYSPVLGELVLRQCRERIERVVGCELVQSYAYWRIYREGAELEPHTDRDAGEVAVTITIEAEPADEVWPIGVADLEGKEASLTLQPGSGVVYQGHRVTHWREPLTTPWQKQLMLFYVQKDGEYEGHAFDGREEDPLAQPAG